MAEAERPLAEYQTLAELFTRRLRLGVRPIATSQLVHPCDSEITQFGAMAGGTTLIQAKGINYPLAELLKNGALAKKLENGFFVTYYLCPTDYHRVHSPIAGLVTSITYVPGTLWPVNRWSVQAVPGLFTINERLIVEIASEGGSLAVVFVGATNVGKISLSFDSTFVTNQRPHPTQVQHLTLKQPVAITKGQELGTFHLGSTVVMVMAKSLVRPAFASLRAGRVRVGSEFSAAEVGP